MTSKNMIKLWQQMAKLTAPVCAKKCRVSHSCCSPEYCDIAEQIAEEEGSTLERVRDVGLKFLGLNGCTVPPHLRPLCTLHVCSIHSMGFSDDAKWDRRYFTLRNKLE